ncbi:MAG: KamA family radical SAM protein [Firmicutes bacterium]|nr:KamA family radical SAM protein [Bacillota bacterium]
MAVWSELLKENVVSIEELEKELHLSPEQKEKLSLVCARHPMRVTRYYLDLIDWSDGDDPIRKLCIPDEQELDEAGEYDTSGESPNTKIPGLQHKYGPTALVLSTNICFTYCRHCFRKRMVGYSDDEINRRVEDAVEYIRGHKEINNVLISGGDPFTLSNEVIEDYLRCLGTIDHLQFIRFGSRVPVVFPQRIYLDQEFLTILKNYGQIKEIVVVTQFNHPRELTEEAKMAISALRKSGCTLRNQGVLLQGVNDNPDTLVALLDGLAACGVHPYYIFQCRPVKHCKHFQVPLAEGIDILAQARKRLNGVAKGFRYVMAHVEGKIEVVGKTDTQFAFKRHQSKELDKSDALFLRPLDSEANWLDTDL